MPRYRFRTATLIGRWRASRREAEADALASGQALLDHDDESKFVWRVPGEIEADETREAR
jgi:hypothetical protein